MNVYVYEGQIYAFKPFKLIDLYGNKNEKVKSYAFLAVHAPAPIASSFGLKLDLSVYGDHVP